MLVCFNLRPAITAVAPLLGEMEHDLGLSLDSSGGFALLPVFVLGIAAPFAPRIARYMAPCKIIFWFLLLSIVGILWRSYGGIIGLFGGMTVVGFGLGIAGASIPGFIKHEFPLKASLMMGIYSALVGLGSATAAAVTVPVAHLLGGWRGGLSFWIIPILIAVAVWGFYFFRHPEPSQLQALNTRMSQLFVRARAWQITLFYMSRVAGAYFFFIWIPILLRQRGMSVEDAGFALSLATISQIPATLAANWLAEKTGDQGQLIIMAFMGAACACWGILYASLEWVIPLGIIYGLGTGLVFSRGMALMVERAESATVAIELSGMAQGVGFTVGALLAFFGSFFLPQEGAFLPFCLLYTLFCVMGIVFGKLSARPGYV
ncbi:MAG: MFS transporter [Akkermansia sp.]